MRRGSDEARVWARRLTFRSKPEGPGDVRTKSVLMALCNYVDEEGVAWPSIGTLADDTDQSYDSVRRRLRDLETLGLIVRFARFVDDSGRINNEGRGRRTSDEIRLVMTITQDELTPRVIALVGGKKVNADEADEASDEGETANGSEQADPCSQQGTPPQQPAGVGPPQPAGGYLAMRPEHEPSLEPESPQEPPLASDAGGDTGVPYERFGEVYGEGSVRPDRARALWEALSPDERELAIRGARGYRAQRQAAKKSLIDPERFLRDQALWREFASKPTADATDMRAVPEASPEARAMRCLRRLSGTQPPTFQSGGQTMIAVKGDLSPQVLALAAAMDERGRKIGQWVKVAVNSNSFGAWRRIVTETIGRGMAVRCADSEVEVPADFPPRADGTWPEFKIELQKAG